MDEMDEVIEEFLVESYENLDQLDQDLISLEENPGETSTLASAFRTIHTIKGTCGFLGFGHLERVTHVGENLLSKLRDGELQLDAEITTALLRMVDAVRTMLGTIEATRTDGDDEHPALVELLSALSEGRATPGTTPSGAVDELDELDESTDGDGSSEPPLVGQQLVDAGAVGPDDVTLALAEQELGDDRPLGEILVDHGSVEPEVVAATVGGAVPETGATPAAGPGDTRHGLSDSTIRVDVGVLDQLMNLVGELVLSRNNIVQHLGGSQEPAVLAASQRLDLVTGELQESVMKTRMQPIRNVWSKFPRVVRDLAISCGKQVRMETEGEETELDKTILEAIKDPLTHIVRNSVDHGIEAPEVRRAAGKAPEGVLRMKAYHEGGQVIIEIVDDGGGIDVTKVVAKAVERGILSPQQAANIGERDAMHLIFAPGFSTAAAVTNVSGRGVGMDVVKTNIEKIGGTVDVSSELGVGTTLRIKIPLTLAIVPAVVISCAGERYAIPQVDVLEVVRLDGDATTESVEMLHNAPVYRLRGKLLPLVDLRHELERPPADLDTLTIAVLGADDRQFGLIIDGVVTTEEIVVKPLGRLLRNVPCFSGATIMGDGTVALILDVVDIARRSGVLAATREALLAESETSSDTTRSNTDGVLVVAGGNGQRVAISLADVARLEELDPSVVEVSGGREVVQYRGELLPLVQLSELGAFGYAEQQEGPVVVVVLGWRGRQVGLVVSEIVDIANGGEVLAADGSTPTMVVLDRVTDVLDVDRALGSVLPWLDAPDGSGAGDQQWSSDELVGSNW